MGWQLSCSRENYVVSYNSFSNARFTTETRRALRRMLK
jgi:hypothetical protein